MKSKDKGGKGILKIITISFATVLFAIFVLLVAGFGIIHLLAQHIRAVDDYCKQEVPKILYDELNKYPKNEKGQITDPGAFNSLSQTQQLYEDCKRSQIVNPNFYKMLSGRKKSTERQNLDQQESRFRELEAICKEKKWTGLQCTNENNVPREIEEAARRLFGIYDYSYVREVCGCKKVL